MRWKFRQARRNSATSSPAVVLLLLPLLLCLVATTGAAEAGPSKRPAMASTRQASPSPSPSPPSTPQSPTTGAPQSPATTAAAPGSASTGTSDSLASSAPTTPSMSPSMSPSMPPPLSSTQPPATLLSSSEPPTGGGSTAATTSSAVPEICINGIKAVTTHSAAGSHERDGGDDDDVGQTMTVRQEREFVEVVEGEAMLSVLTGDPTSALFVVNRLNEANLIEADFEIGVRAIHVASARQAQNLLIQEVEYMQQCITHAIGIFLDHDLYASLAEIIKDLEYNIWPIPSPRLFLFPRAAHLLQQLPWGERIASVELVTDRLEVYNEFMEAVRREQMCLMHFRSADNIYIVFGSRGLAQRVQKNGTYFVVPMRRTDRSFLRDLPDQAFVLMESEVGLRALDEASAGLDDVLAGRSVLPSRVLALARPLLALAAWVKGSLAKHCRRLDDVYVLDTCFNFLTFVADWTTTSAEVADAARTLELLQMRPLAKAMNFHMYQKRVHRRHAGDDDDDEDEDDDDEDEEGVDAGRKDIKAGADELEAAHRPPPGRMELREVASQNFITNVTTFYHYNRSNHTSLQLPARTRTRFGQVFNCQYVSGDNPRYPFLFEGESVMFWRLKRDTWVATGLTAASLGLLVTLAVLVFIAVRISLGDVFEGNPATSILLLLSLLLLFVSFVPFALEYVGEHRNSHVTYEDAGILNTLCAVRVFVVTLVYCFAFSLLLCRAVMLASIGSEGGFLSHVNGHIQSVICLLSVLVQLGMSVQLLVVMHVASESVSCEDIYYGRWLWALVAYDLLLLVGIVALVPLIYRSQRNYREGILIVIGAVLVLVIWLVWIVLALFGDAMRDAAVALGLQATGWAILFGILIPRTFLIVRGIERSDIAQALPSLTSLAFAQNNQYSSEQSVYECVNPAMRHCSQEDVHQSPSEIPTLPLRGGGPRRQQFFANLRQANANINPQRPPPRPQRGGGRDNDAGTGTVSPTHSSLSSAPGSPENNKITRF